MAAWDLLTVIPKSLDYKLASHSSTSWTSMLEIPITIKGWLKLVPGLPGKPFKPFFNLFYAKTFFSQFLWKAFFSLFFSVVFKIAPKWPFQSLHLQKNSSGRTPGPHLWKGKPCCTHHTCRIGAHSGTGHRFMPSCPPQKVFVEEKCLKIEISG